MLGLFGREKVSILDEPIDKVLARMDKIDLFSEEYSALLTELERLVRLQNEEKYKRVSPDTMAVVFGNLLGILIIVGYEHGHVIGSRGLNFILRTKHQ
jgi:hypothetical protein